LAKKRFDARRDLKATHVNAQEEEMSQQHRRGETPRHVHIASPNPDKFKAGFP